MKKKIIKNEKLVLKKDTITRLNSVQMQQFIGGGPPVRTTATSCCCGTDQGGNSQNSQGGSCYTCGQDLSCEYEC
jgi:hypothetical protein